MSEQREATDHPAGDLGQADVSEKLKEEVAKGPLDEQSGDPSTGEASHDAVGQTAPTSESDLTP
ncbi:MAG TPA: hypothetical protein VG294_19075 [Solirubrobacteraceae bacterium]|nr:hypothetical protein [Solirubrobacteraceae bacterium]